MKRILGLDLGTNSIGWALIERDFEDEIKNNVLGEGEVLGMGSRIIPMDKGMMDTFGSGGQIETGTSERTGYRGVRRLRQRHLLRRERLHRVLNIINALPEHYADKIDFDNKKGQFIDHKEIKLNYKEVEFKKFEFLFKASFEEMVYEFKNVHPELFYTKSNGEETKIPYDWTIYFLRKKALERKISLQELAWILLNFNQKRGYYQLRGEEQEEDKSKLVEFHALKVVDVSLRDETDTKTEVWYNIKLENDWIYPRKSKKPLNDWVGKTKEFIVTTPLDENGNPKKDKEGNINRSFRAPKEDDWTLIKTKTQNEIEKFNNCNNTLGVGTYIYDNLLKNPKQKINGKLVRTIERHFYKDELTAIFEKQKEFHPELTDNSLLEKCIFELYPNNYAWQNILKQKDLNHLLVNDIIFYQRPFKSKKSLIDGCKYETRTFKNEEGEYETKSVKAIHKSHPLYQEFRIWQFIDNIKIYEREKIINGKLMSDVDITAEFIPDEEAKVSLFEFFNDKAKIKQKTFLTNYKDDFGKKLSEDKYRWNYVEDKEYPLNETRALFISKLSKDKSFDWKNFLTPENEIKLWHLLYSIRDKKEFEKAFRIQEKHENDIVFGLPYNIRREFIKIKPFPNDYGALSEKAIKKILPLMRIGQYWNYESIDDNTKDRIQKILTGEFDDKIRDRVREKTINLSSENDFKGLPLWLVSYVVYDRHSESSDNTKWEAPKQLDKFLEEFKQHSLRNPIVEQVITETLRVVRDIWQQYGNGETDFFDEIHVELGREMKNPADRRKQMTAQINKNQDTNERIRILLREFKSENIEGVIPHSLNQQEKLKIFEEDILSQYSEKELEKEVYDGVNIAKIAKSSEPTPREIQKYKLWMEQKYFSPYTGQLISLSKLFTTEYEIEHIIPQARYFDNSFGNKVICETEVNKTKGNQTAFEFIGKNPGRKIDLGKGKSVTLFDVENYQNFVSKNFKKGSKKFKILLSEEIPEQFIARQLNDTRYISKVVKSLLSNIVRTDDEAEATSKNIVAVTGGVTTVLKKDWGLNDKWNEIVQSRFERLNKLTGTNDFGYFDKDANFFRTNVPKELKKGFNKKRIDHRHHAMDALVVALATRNHVSYLNNEHAKSDNKRYDLRNKLRNVEEIQIGEKTKKVSKEFYLPWSNFPVEVKKAMENTVVSFKQNKRVQTKATNTYWSYYDEKGNLRKDKAGNPKKGFTKQTKGNTRAVRKPMHDPMPYGKIYLWFDVLDIFDSQNNIQFIIDENIKDKVQDSVKSGFSKAKKDFKKHTKQYNKLFTELEKLNKKLKEHTDDEHKKNKLLSEVDSLYSEMESIKTNIIVNDAGYALEKTWFKIVNTKYGKRQPLEKLLSGKDYAGILKSINKIGDYNLQVDLIEHLNKYFSENNTEFAFSPGGIDEFNSLRRNPVYNVRSVESGTKRFKLGDSEKHVEATDGNNLFFAVYWDNDKKKRDFETIPLMEVIEHQKWRAGLEKEERDNTPLIPVDRVKGELLFYLSPNDLVYVPTEEELENPNLVDWKTLTKEQVKRIYKMVSTTGGECHFIPNTSSIEIIKNENGTNSKSERLQNYYDGHIILDDNKIESKRKPEMIKNRCWKLKVDRLGNIIGVEK